MSRGKNSRIKKYKKRHLTRLGALKKETTNSITQIGDNNEYSK